MSSTKATSYTVNSIKAANRAAGFHWFDPSTMRFFGSRILPAVYQGIGGVYFVTCDKAGFDDADGREYNVRRFKPETGEVGTAYGVEAFKNSEDAKNMAARLAFGNLADPITITEEEYKPVGILEQFVHECRTHGNGNIDPQTCREFIQAAGRYRRQCEHECNGTGRRSPVLEKRLSKFGELVGAKAVMLEGDPRGCVVKLRWHDGATNDFGSEGWCVPTSEKAD